MNAKARPVKRIALSLSLLLILLWAVLGAGTSLAWFSDTSHQIENIFHFSSFELEVEYRGSDGRYYDLEGSTKVFDENALYEPGYVQVVYLRVKNTGSLPFNFSTAVNVTDYTKATNFFGQSFLLQEYLLFGITAADTEAQLNALLSNREQASALATTPLNNYAVDHPTLKPDETCYIGIVVTMPKDVENSANYRLTPIPRVDLGLIITATQVNS